MPLTVSDLTFGTPLEGVEPNRIVSVVHASPKHPWSELLAALVQSLSALGTALVKMTVNVEGELPEGVSADVRAANEKALADRGVGTSGVA